MTYDILIIAMIMKGIAFSIVTLIAIIDMQLWCVSMNIMMVMTLPSYSCAPAPAPPQCLARPGGDGVKVPSEGCDDGNTLSGDGCSSSCSIEIGGSACCTPCETGVPWA